MKINPKIIAIVLAVICVIILVVILLKNSGGAGGLFQSLPPNLIREPLKEFPPAQPPYKPTDQELVFAKYW
jgi:hypothetical protein